MHNNNLQGLETQDQKTVQRMKETRKRQWQKDHREVKSREYLA